MRPTSPGAAPSTIPHTMCACPTPVYTRGMGGEEEDQGCASRLTRQATRESVINTVTPETMGFAITRLKRQLSESTAGPFVMSSPKMGAYCLPQMCVTRSARFRNYIHTPIGTKRDLENVSIVIFIHSSVEMDLIRVITPRSTFTSLKEKFIRKKKILILTAYSTDGYCV